MKLKSLLLSVLVAGVMLPVSAAKFSAQLWGNFTYNWAELLGDVAQVRRLGSQKLPPIPTFPETKLAVWSHTGNVPGKLTPAHMQKLRAFVAQGGVLVVFDTMPVKIFPSVRHDIKAAQEVLGSAMFCYNSPKSAPTELGRKILGDTLKKGDIYSGKSRTHGSLQHLSGMKVLIGSKDRADLGVHRIGKGAVIYYAGGYRWGFPCAVNAPFAVMMKKLVLNCMNPKFLDKYFPDTLRVQLWGNMVRDWAKMFENSAEIQTFSAKKLPLIPAFPETHLAIWSHGSRTSCGKFTAEQMIPLRKFVEQGGVLVVFDCVPIKIFPSVRHDLYPARNVLGSAMFCYNSPKSAPTELGRKILGDTLKKGDIYSVKSRTHGSLQKLCGMQVLIGSNDRADLGVHRIGKGAVIYYAGGYRWGFPCAVDAPFAVMMKKLVQTCLDQQLLQKYFPGQPGNAAITVDGKKLHLTIQAGKKNGGANYFLRDKMRQITGKSNFFPHSTAPEFTIHVGQTPYVKTLNLDFDSLHPFGYYMVCRDGRNLVLAGKHDKGTIYAVNDFLKRFANYRKFGKADFMEVLPKAASIKVPAKLELREEPSIKSYMFSMWRADNFGRSCRLNSMATHSMDKLVPIKQYAKTHPEYFPFNNGKRMDMTAKKLDPWNPCMCNPDLPKLVEIYAKKYFKANPEALSLPLGVNDGGGDCHCPGCQAKLAKYGNLYAEFYNMAARVVAKNHPGKMVAFIAYGHAASKAPRNLKMEPNILVECIGSVVNGVNNFEAWKKAGVRNFGLYNYHYAIDAGMVVPQYYPHVIGRHWQELHKKYNIKSMWHEYIPDMDIMSSGRMYVLNELAWNIEADIDALLADYFQNMFENIAPEMQKFFEQLEQSYERSANKLYPMKHWYRHSQMDIYTWADLQKMDQLLAQAATRPMSALVKRRFEAVRRIYNMSRLHIINHLCTQEIRQSKVTSLEQCRQMTALIRRGYEALNRLQNLNYSEAEQKDMFISKKRMHNFLSSKLAPQPFLEAASDAGMAKISTFLKANGLSIEDFIQKELTKCDLPEYKAMLSTQLYLQNHKPVNLINNPSFEMVKISGKMAPSRASDHIAIKEIPHWRTWTFPNAYTHFGVTSKFAHSGKKCAFIGENQIRGMLLYYAWLDKPHARYHLSCWTRQHLNKKQLNSGSLSVRFIGKKGWLDNGASIRTMFTPDCQDNWVYYETSFTTPDEPVVGLIQLEAPHQVPGEFTYVDDFSLELIYVPGAEKKK